MLRIGRFSQEDQSAIKDLFGPFQSSLGRWFFRLGNSDARRITPSHIREGHRLFNATKQLFAPKSSRIPPANPFRHRPMLISQSDRITTLVGAVKRLYIIILYMPTVAPTGAVGATAG